MNLTHPRTTLAGCCWLPRLTAKTRGYLRGEMPLSYRLAFGSRIGVDGYFFRHFQLTRAQVIAAVRTSADDEALAHWFIELPAVTAESIAAWNEIAPKLCLKGHPGFTARQCVKWVFYPKSVSSPVSSIFEAIVQDENLAR